MESNKSYDKKAKAVKWLRLNSSDDKKVKAFSAASKTYSAKVTKSSTTAKNELVRLGMLTPSGKLTKRYK